MVSIQLQLNITSKFSEEDEIIPDVFVVVVLSHGLKNGLILTDQLKDPSKDLKTVKAEDFLNFNSEQLFESLKTNKMIQSSLKLVFLGV